VGRERLVESEHLVPIFRGGPSRGSHVRALAEALMCLIDFMPEVPSARRVALRNTLAALRRAYPELREDTGLSQWLAEEDGVPQDDQV